MAGWKKATLGGLVVHQAKTISWLPNIVQGFTTRNGGVSPGQLNSLNMSESVGDSAENVTENRRRVVSALASPPFHVATAKQVHGDGVAVIETVGQSTVVEADALITNVPEVLLMMVYADCVPVYLVDPLKNAIGIVHSGWRGTAKNAVGKAITAMRQQYDIQPWKLLAAIGPSISVDNYEVSKEVVDALWNVVPQGSSQAFIPRGNLALTYSLNLRLIVFAQLQAFGLDPENIAVSDECTFRNSNEFFSHRRDGSAEVPVGRMAGLIGLKPMRR
jgi:YfiH family protein